MTKKQDGGKTAPTTRQDRLKDALKANIARRKAQAEARRAAAKDGTGPGGKHPAR
jgi:hypothetical protein